MKLDSLNRWLTLGANVGVLVGIALILVELNQSRQLAQAQFTLDVDQVFREAEVAMMEGDLSDDWEASIMNPESLTASSVRSLDSYYATIVNRWARTYELEQQGLAAEGTTAEQMRSASFFFGNRFAVRWWSYDRVNWTPEFAAMVDQTIAVVDENANKNWILSLQSDFRETP